MGLKKSEHIGMIEIDPKNSNKIYVAAYGPLWNKGGERGLYLSENFGKDWKLILEKVRKKNFLPENPIKWKTFFINRINKTSEASSLTDKTYKPDETSFSDLSGSINNFQFSSMSEKLIWEDLS